MECSWVDVSSLDLAFALSTSVDRYMLVRWPIQLGVVPCQAFITISGKRMNPKTSKGYK